MSIRLIDDMQAMSSEATTACAAARAAVAADPSEANLNAYATAVGRQHRFADVLERQLTTSPPDLAVETARASFEANFCRALSRPCLLAGLTGRLQKGHPERVTTWFVRARITAAQLNMPVDDYRTAIWLTATFPVGSPASEWWLGRCTHYPARAYISAVAARPALPADAATGRELIPEVLSRPEQAWRPIGGCYTVNHLHQEYERHFMTLSAEEEYREEFAALLPSIDTKSMTLSFNRLRPLIMSGHSQVELMESYSRLLHSHYRVRVFQVKTHTSVEDLQATALALHDAELRAARIAKQLRAHTVTQGSDSEGSDAPHSDHCSESSDSSDSEELGDPYRGIAAAPLRKRAAARRARTRVTDDLHADSPICKFCLGDHRDVDCPTEPQLTEGLADDGPTNKSGDESVGKSGELESSPPGEGTKGVTFALKRKRTSVSNSEEEEV